MTEIELIAEALEELSDYVRVRYADRVNIAVSAKGNPNDVLTEVDVAVQERFAARLRETFPDDLLVGEEGELARIPDAPDARCWIIDPIDGTQNFVRSLYPAFGISVAFARGGRVVAGGVALPVTHDLFLAERGVGATRNGRPLAVSQVATLANARVEVDFGTPGAREEVVRYAAGVIEHAGQLRCHCAAVIGLCSIATGDMDAYVHARLHPWDFAAALLIAEEAGARSSRFDGAPLALFEDNLGILVTNGRFHDEMLAVIGESSR